MRKILNYTLLFTILALFFWYIARGWDVEVLKQIDFNGFYLLMSLFCLIIHYFLVSKLSHHLLIVKKPLAFKDYLNIYFLSQLGRYIPGKVWMILGKLEALRKKGYSVSWVTFAFFHEMLFMLLGAGVVSVLAFPFVEQFFNGLSGAYKWIASLLLFAVILFLRPVFIKLNELYGRLAKKSSNAESKEYPYSQKTIYSMTLFYSFSWLLQGVGFSLLVKSIFPFAEISPMLIFVYPVAWAFGFLALFSPSGLGVRESVLIFLLGFVFQPSEAAVLSIAARVWATSAEIIVTLFSLIVFGIFKKKQT